MKTLRSATLAILAMICISIAIAEPQISKTVTFSTGTAIRVSTTPTRANSLFVQMLPGSTAVGYVLYAPLEKTCVASDASQVVATLSPGTATAPGASFTYPSNNPATNSAGGFDVSRWCVQGTTGDTAVVSYDVRN